MYLDDMLVKNLIVEQHIKHLRECFDIQKRYNVKLNQTNFAFGVSSRNILGFMVHNCSIDAIF